MVSIHPCRHAGVMKIAEVRERNIRVVQKDEEKARLGQASLLAGYGRSWPRCQSPELFLTNLFRFICFGTCLRVQGWRYVGRSSKMYASSCSYLYMTVTCFYVLYLLYVFYVFYVVYVVYVVYVFYRLSTFFVGLAVQRLGQVQGLRSDMVVYVLLLRGVVP
ncbi:hypothetical protein V1505DRAFT_380494 [Lipomyces doorenjongii]